MGDKVSVRGKKATVVTTTPEGHLIIRTPDGTDWSVHKTSLDEVKKITAAEEPQKTKKTYGIQYNVGKAKYVVNYYDGVKTHNDGSKAYDIAIFKNKKKLESFLNDLKKKNYVRESALSS